MATLLPRAILAFLALPGLVAFAVPILVARADSRIASFHPIALLPLAAGIAMLLWCVRYFYASGKGTLAPWDPPRNLVASGPYRFSRNPMYVAVGLILLGWAIGFRARSLWLYAVAVFVGFHLRVVFGEEPWLARTHRRQWESYTASVPRWLFPTRRVMWWWIGGGAIVLALCGLLYEALAEGMAARAYSPPGTLVDVGGRRLHLVCIGQGAPIVMFEPGGFGVGSLASSSVREQLAARTRVCSYDRMGMGWSDPGPSVVSAAALARDLAVLQDRAGLPGPIVLVASSVGGLTAEMFARQYPERVGGLVFLDAASSGAVRAFQRYFIFGRLGAPLLSLAARLGVIRLLNPFDMRGNSDAVRRSAAFTYSTGAFGTLSAILRGLPDTLQEFETAPAFPSAVPLVVLSASDPNLLDVPELRDIGTDLMATRRDYHRALAALSTRGSWQLVPDSSHLIAASQPAVVAETVAGLLTTVR